MNTDPELLKKLIQKGSFLPKEEMLEVERKKGSLFIGIPKETSFQERRVALVPETVSLLVAHGHEVKVESKAGEGANFSDNDYSEAGAQICKSRKEIYECNIVFKVTPPSDDEVDLMPGNQTFISALQISIQPKQVLTKLIKKKITAIAWDYIQDEEGVFSVVRTVGEIAGNTSILIAGELISSFSSGKGMMLGGIAGVQPTEVVIIGAGTVGEFATRAALGLGASVKVFDNRLSKLRRLQNDIGQRVYTSIIQPKVLAKAIRRADIVIGALRSSVGKTPCVVTELMIQEMKSGSVIVDVSIDQGGCFETSRITNHDDPTFVKHGVTHYCVPNIASRVSRTASFAISNIFSPLLLEMGERGGVVDLIRSHSGFRNGVYIYKGILTNEVLGKVFNLNYKDINLILPGI
ncbi:MAG: alanine dehydrogenase [Flavobacteriales bacterium]|mgnify:FL=1|jgi:alanine dehydrogenase|nr:alanine dehydrogenase [Flavobacteriales bacterium]MDA7761651.1 alanine dehydrogenase [Crocinitomicaceae bacterium]MDG1720284.1 alanine dehydrogenase [Bacteroidia bacterium]MBT5932439.1 alanine dehydrogenase [Flavobacteriales bacterium]MDC0459168.1 alanine dehydrogenase [Crocinitomicaceae bacterium]